MPCNSILAIDVPFKGETRVSPLKGTSIAKMELQGMVQCARLLKTAVEALPFHVERVVLMGDSMCSIMAARNDGVVFLPFFQNRVQEIRGHLQDIKGRVGMLEEVLKVPGSLNPADLATRPGTKPEDMGENSRWQRGPRFLVQPRVDWPVHIPDNVGAIPEDEIRRCEVGLVVDDSNERLYGLIRKTAEGLRSYARL